MSRKPVPLSLEPLDGRVLPSSTMPVVGGPLPPVYIHPTHPLAGRATGDYLSKRGNPDTGVTDTVHGTGHVFGMGDVTVTGTIHGPGFINSTTFTGTMTFKNAHGGVKVELTSFRPAGPAGLPVWYRYHVVKATGDYAGMHDNGSLRLDVTPHPSTGNGMDRTGTFRVTI